MRNVAIVMAAVALMCCGPMVCAAAVTVGTFTGADVGDGLDLDGNFIYAVDLGWNGTDTTTGGGTIRDAVFTHDGASGVKVSWGTREQDVWWPKNGTVLPPVDVDFIYGDSTGDNTLEEIMNNRRYNTNTVNGFPVRIQLGLDGGTKLIEGQQYKLQMALASSLPRAQSKAWDLVANHGGTYLKDNMLVPYDDNTVGHLLTWEFTATAAHATDWLTADVRCGNWTGSGGDDVPAGWDERFPALNMVTLELLGAATRIPGDANLDNIVNDADASILAAHWQQTEMSWGDGDFNADNVVNDADASILAAHWQESQEGAAPVPEPSTLIGLLALGLAGLAALRLR